MNRPVLVTRTAPGSEKTLSRLRAKGFAAIAAPTALIQALEVDPVETAGAVAVTSPNGALRAGELVADKVLPLFAVGAATAEAAREQGFTTVHTGGGEGEALAALILKQQPPAPVVHIRGRDLAFDLVAALEAGGVEAVTCIAYAAEPVQTLPSQAVDALKVGATVLIHSAKGAERFLALARSAGLSDRLPFTRAVAISRPAADPLVKEGLERIDIAERPNEDSLFAALAGAAR